MASRCRCGAGGWGRRSTCGRNRTSLELHRLLQVAILAVIASVVVTSVLGVHSQGDSSGWTNGILQSLAYGAATFLCFVRTPPASSERILRAFVVLGVMSLGLSNLDRHEWLLRTLDPFPVTTLCHLLRAGFYICVATAIVLLIRSRVGRLSLTVGLDGVVVSLGAATIAALLAPLLGGGSPQSAIALVRPVAELLLLTLVLGAVALLRSPPLPLWLLAGSLLMIGSVDYVDSTQGGSYESGGLVDAAWMVAVTALALTPGWYERPGIARVPAKVLTSVAPLLVSAAVISVLVTASYAHVRPEVRCLAVAVLVTALARQVTAFSEERNAGEQARLARTDELTSLVNRRGFYDQAAPMFSRKSSGDRRQPTCALLLLDLNHFKDFNDSLGHAAGDEILRRVAARLRASLREEDILARLGGDEFAMILPNVGVNKAVQAALALATALEQTVVLDGLHVRTDASIGIALAPQHGEDLGTLLRHADLAMYRAKNAHVGYLVYTPDTDQCVTTRAGMELLAEFRDAIEHRDLAVHYQPKLSLQSGEMVGVEALVRWHHPDRGVLYPDQFLPLARHNGLMRSMTELVVERALADAADWHARGHQIPVAINLFPPTLADLDLPCRLDDALMNHGLSPSALTVEITEEFILTDLDRARFVLAGIRRLGISIAIDDFGSGYSSLSYLHGLPIDEVKLDRSFIASITEDHRAAAIVRSVIDLSHTLGLTTVAEGVETADIATVLGSYGCDIVQGHYFGRPITAPELLELVNEPTHTTGHRLRNCVGGLRLSEPDAP